MRADQMGFVTASRNRKTGKIPVSTARRLTCPSTCPFKRGGCYAADGPVSFWWQRLDEGTWGISWEEFLARVRALSPGTLWRHAQAGDLPGRGTSVDRKRLRELTEANRGRLGYTYTHKPPNSGNLSAIREAVKGGFTVNLSANGPSTADKLFDSGLPVATVVRKGTPAVSFTPRGRKIVVCPAQRKEGMNCSRCRLCARADRGFIVGFLPHGKYAGKVSQVAAVN